MSKTLHKLQSKLQRRRRIRAVVSGTTERPRLSVHVSNMHVSAQLIDDTTHSTIAHVTTVGQKAVSGTMSEKATWVGTEIAKKAQAANVTKVVFDRGGNLYHGRVKALADAAREQGLEF